MLRNYRGPLALWILICWETIGALWPFEYVCMRNSRYLLNPIYINTSILFEGDRKHKQTVFSALCMTDKSVDKLILTGFYCLFWWQRNKRYICFWHIYLFTLIPVYTYRLPIYTFSCLHKKTLISHKHVYRHICFPMYLFTHIYLQIKIIF